MRLLRKKESYRWDDQTLYPTKTYKITPFLKLMMTPSLRTLDLTRIKKECISDCAAVLHLATMRIPVRVLRITKLYREIHFSKSCSVLLFSTWRR